MRDSRGLRRSTLSMSGSPATAQPWFDRGTVTPIERAQRRGPDSITVGKAPPDSHHVPNRLVLMVALALCARVEQGPPIPADRVHRSDVALTAGEPWR